MIYICYWEMCPEDLDKVIPLFQEMVKLRGKPDYPKELFATYGFSGQMKGFTIYEVDNEQQRINHYIHYHPYLKLKWVPLMEAKDFIKTYLEKKK